MATAMVCIEQNHTKHVHFQRGSLSVVNAFRNKYATYLFYE